jgi:peptide deformylase
VTAYPLRIFGDPVLRGRARDVDDVDANLVALVHGMYETMEQEAGVGLAAPQVGVARRLFTYDLHDDDGPAVVLNPEIVESSGEQVGEEGCLSVPGLRFEVIRAAHVVMRGLDLDGREVVLAGDGLLARMVQHEIDHLDGVLVLDRVDPDIRREALRELRVRDLPTLAGGARDG